MTEGEHRVGIAFNPGKKSEVDGIKTLAAAMIDNIIAWGKDDRCTEIACAEIESGAMWAVKSITKPPREDL